jgi:CheY-like chemotaxis protein
MLRTSLLATPELDSEQQANVAIIDRLIEQAAASVRRLQQFASDRGPVSDTTDLGVVLRDEVRAFHSAANAPPDPTVVKTVLNISPLLPKVVGSDRDLRYVVATLLRNAREAMPRGGTVEVVAHPSGDRVLLTVADEGTGISEERLAHVFEPFFNTKAGQVGGLGLPGSFAIMARLGGTISAANRPQCGAIFKLSFPLFKETAMAAASKFEAPSGTEIGEPSPKHRVLVIDDDLDNLEAMKESLERRGYEVETACDGHQGIELLGNRPQFDSVICDVGMPVVNGWEVAQEITQIAPATRVYMLTGWANEIPQSDPRRRAVADVMAKPTSIEQIEAALGRKR